MDNSDTAASIIAEHERDAARLRCGLRRLGWAVRIFVLIVVVYGAGMLVVGLLS